MTDDKLKAALAQRAKDPFHEGAAAARSRRIRSLAIAGGLVFFVLLIFAVSILRLSQNAHMAAQATASRAISPPEAPRPARAWPCPVTPRRAGAAPP